MLVDRVKLELWVRVVFVTLFFIGVLILLGMIIHFGVEVYEASGAYEIIKARDLLLQGW